MDEAANNIETRADKLLPIQIFKEQFYINIKIITNLPPKTRKRKRPQIKLDHEKQDSYNYKNIRLIKIKSN